MISVLISVLICWLNSLLHVFLDCKQNSVAYLLASKLQLCMNVGIFAQALEASVFAKANLDKRIRTSLPKGKPLPKGTTLSKGRSLPEGTTLSKGTTLPKGTSLTKGTTLPKGTSLPKGEQSLDKRYGYWQRWGSPCTQAFH